MLIWTIFIDQFVHLVGGKGMGLRGGWFKPAATITLLEYMRIWYDIQVIIYRRLGIKDKIQNKNDNMHNIT